MVSAFLLAAGKSSRFGTDKLFERIGDRTVFELSLDFLEASPRVAKIFIAANAANKKKISKIVKNRNYKKVGGIILGGSTRFESVKKCITAITPSTFFILHNAANPFATQEELTACFDKLRGNISGVAVGRLVTSTLKLAPGGSVVHTLLRQDVWETETPQVVRARDFLKACEFVMRRQAQHDMIDDLSVLESAGFKTFIVPASPFNKKITAREDLETLRLLAGAEVSAVGIGEDSHRFELRNYEITELRKRNLVLGGVKIPGLPALEAESDGDVMLHALCNAISSALGKGSLGTYASVMCRKGIKSSREYLKKNLELLKRSHRRIQHVSFSIEAARPAIDPLVPKMKEQLKTLLQIPEANIGITATSGEKLTSFGRGKAIKCQAIVLLQSVRTRK